MPVLDIGLYRKLPDGTSVVVHQELQVYNMRSQVISEVMKYVAIAIQNDLPRVDVGLPDVYIWRRGNEILVLQIG